MAFPVSFFQIQGEDPKQLIKFYQTAFDWQGAPAADGGLMVAAEAGGIPGALGPSSDGAAHLAIYITVENVTKHLERAKRAGARVVTPETELPENLGSIGGFLDPAGNWVGVWAASAAGSPQPPTKKTVTNKTPRKKAPTRRAPAPKKTVTKKTPRKKAPTRRAPAPKRGAVKKAAAKGLLKANKRSGKQAKKK